MKEKRVMPKWLSEKRDRLIKQEFERINPNEVYIDYKVKEKTDGFNLAVYLIKENNSTLTKAFRALFKDHQDIKMINYLLRQLGLE